MDIISTILALIIVLVVLSPVMAGSYWLTMKIIRSVS